MFDLLELVHRHDETKAVAVRVELLEEAIERRVGVVGSERILDRLAHDGACFRRQGVVKRQREVVEQLTRAVHQPDSLHVEVHDSLVGSEARAQVVQDGGLAHPPVAVEHR